MLLPEDSSLVTLHCFIG